jgi:hypothetical protein
MTDGVTRTSRFADGIQSLPPFARPLFDFTPP